MVIFGVNELFGLIAIFLKIKKKIVAFILFDVSFLAPFSSSFKIHSEIQTLWPYTNSDPWNLGSNHYRILEKPEITLNKCSEEHREDRTLNF